MAGRGPAPGQGAKPADQRRRRNAPTTEQFEIIEADGELHGPGLPDTHDWPDVTTAWWETWRKSAMAPKFTDTDWSFLLDTAVLHADFWLGNRALAGELRLRVAKFGATVEDRARLKVEIGDPNKVPAPRRLQPKSAQNRKARLLRAVGDDGAATE